MEGVFKHYKMKVGAKKERGVATVSAFKIVTAENPIAAMRAAMNGMAYQDGKYIRLSVNGQLMMSDTDMEKNSNREFCRAANGKVLIAGLGIGLILYNILSKPGITQITVVEKYQDVIDLVSPFFTDKRIVYICADIMEWRPAKGEKFDTIYFDIWPDINTDNLKDIKLLHNAFKNKLNRDNLNCWMDSWMKRRLQAMDREDKKDGLVLINILKSVI